MLHFCVTPKVCASPPFVPLLLLRPDVSSLANAWRPLARLSSNLLLRLEDGKKKPPKNRKTSTAAFSCDLVHSGERSRARRSQSRAALTQPR